MDTLLLQTQVEREKDAAVEFHNKILDELAIAWLSEPNAYLETIIKRVLELSNCGHRASIPGNHILLKSLQNFNKIRKADATKYHYQS